MRDALLEPVGDLLREVAAEAILPRFRALAQGEVTEKAPGEVVTVADREAERLLTHGLARLLPGAPVVGEEAVAERPGLLEHLSEAPCSWLVDPLDGTANFVAGDERFAVMATLLEHGAPVAAWILAPRTGRLAVASRGAGAWLDGERLGPPAEAPEPEALRGAALLRFLPPGLAAGMAERSTALGEVLPGLRCAGLEYPAVAAGEQDFALFWRTLPWDHAPGALLVKEAGGRVARFDGAPYRLGDGRKGLLVARSPHVWEAVARILLPKARARAKSGAS